MYHEPRDRTKGVVSLPGRVRVYTSYVRGDFSAVGARVGGKGCSSLFGVPGIDVVSLDDFRGPKGRTGGVGGGSRAPGPIVSLGSVPTPRGVGTALSRCIVKRRCTGGMVSMNMCGRCGEITASAVSSVRVRGSGVLVVKPANYNGACLIGVLTELLRMPLTVTSTASLARTNCVNSSVRDMMSGLLTTTSGSIRGTRRKVVFVSRVSGVTGGGGAGRESIDKRTIRRKLLGLLRKDRIRIPMNTADGGTVMPVIAMGAEGVLFVYNNTFPSLRGVVGRELGGRTSVKFCTSLGSGCSSSPRILRGMAMSSLHTFKVVPRFVNHLPVVFALGKLARSVLIGVLGRPGGTVLGRCGGLLTLSRMGLRFRSNTLRTVTHGTLRHRAKTETLQTVLRRCVLSVVCRVPGSSGVNRIIVARKCVRNGKNPGVLVHKRRVPTLRKWRAEEFFGVWEDIASVTGDDF